MCRMIGYISVDKISPIKYLYDSECSLYVQAVKGKQKDGWGLGYYIDNTLKVIKDPHTVYKKKDNFLKIINSVKSDLLIAHVRNASNPRNLPHEKLISYENTQPFFYKNYVFVHNGTVRVVEIENKLGKYKGLVKGVNDSELYFYLFIKYLEEEKSVPEALKQTEKTMWDTFKEIDREIKNPFSSLNMIFSDGEKLYAFNRYQELYDKKSICYGDAPIFRMTYLYNGNILVVASERTNDDKWKLMDNNELLIAERKNNKIKYTIEKI